MSSFISYLIDFDAILNHVASLSDIYYYQQEFQEHLKTCIDNMSANMSQMKYLGIYTVVATDFLTKFPKYWPSEVSHLFIYG
jgi:hypothetical protein